MAVCCQNLPLGALSSRSAPSMLVGELFKKFGLLLNTGVYRCDSKEVHSVELVAKYGKFPPETSGRQKVVTETNKGNKVCILLVILTCMFKAAAQYLPAHFARACFYFDFDWRLPDVLKFNIK